MSLRSRRNKVEDSDDELTNINRETLACVDFRADLPSNSRRRTSPFGHQG